MLTYILDLLLVALAAGMLLKGHYGITRQLAFGPLLAAVLSASSAHLVDPSLTPGLSALLVALQLFIFALGGVILYRDYTVARNKQARRQRRRELAQSREAFQRATERKQAARRTAPQVA